jgi:drug/metabolite transporter (DMT)-like permease
LYLRGIVYALASSLMFGLGAVLAKFLTGAFDSTLISLLTLTVGGLLLAGALALTKTPLLPILRTLNRQEWLDLFLLACPGGALPLVVIVAGFARTSALEGALLLQLNGAVALFSAVLLLHERILPKQRLGVLLLVLGGALIVANGTAGSASSVLGDILILLGAVGVGFAVVPAKRLGQHISPLPLSVLRLLFGAVTILPVAAVQFFLVGGVLLWQPSPTNMTIFLVYIVTNFSLAYLFQQRGFRLLKAWQMVAIGQTVPLFSTLFAVLLLNERLTVLQGVGGLLAILGGVVVSLAQESAPSANLAAIAPGHETSEKEQTTFTD